MFVSEFSSGGGCTSTCAPVYPGPYEVYFYGCDRNPSGPECESADEDCLEDPMGPFDAYPKRRGGVCTRVRDPNLGVEICITAWGAWTYEAHGPCRCMEFATGGT